MSRRLETLAPGTPVFCGDRLVGTVEGVYTEGTSRLPEYLAVHWNARSAPILVSTNDVESIEARGVVLQCADPTIYDTTATFEPARYPTIKKLA
jgi:hypothetical protein